MKKCIVLSLLLLCSATSAFAATITQCSESCRTCNSHSRIGSSAAQSTPRISGGYALRASSM